MPPVLCHLEYNSRWEFRLPTSHEVDLSHREDALRLAWHVEDDPVTYEVRMTADRADSVLVEVRLQNAGRDPVPVFTPGFCLQLMGSYSPTTFAYTIIPPCLPGESSSIFGRMVFFEGSWEELYAWARREKADLEARSSRLDEAQQSDSARSAFSRNPRLHRGPPLSPRGLPRARTVAVPSRPVSLLIRSAGATTVSG